MMSIEVIIKLNEKIARQAKRHGRKPNISYCDKNAALVCPNLGYYVPKGWKLVQKFFVDKTGCGGAGEPAMTEQQLINKIRKGYGYAIIEEGEMQLYIGEFEKI